MRRRTRPRSPGEQADPGEVEADGRILSGAPGQDAPAEREGDDADRDVDQEDGAPLAAEHVHAYSLEVSLVNERRTRDENGWVVSRDELLRRFAALPDAFPRTKRYAAELTAGTGHDRFDFTIGLLLDGLAHR